MKKKMNQLRHYVVMALLAAGLVLVIGAIASAQLPEKHSIAFDYKYEMDALPTTVDVDGVDGVDWNLRRFLNGTTSESVAGGVLTFTSDRVNSAHYYTADEQTSTNISPGVVGIWPGKTNLADGWTAEISVKVVSDLGNMGALMIGGETATTTPQSAILAVRATGQYWGRGTKPGEPYVAIGDPLDNSDGFHSFRIVQDPNSGGVESETTWRVWRDNVLLAESLATGDNTNIVERVFFGHGAASWAGSVEIDYFRFTPGAFAPSDEMPSLIPGDANNDYKVDAADAAILAANWLKHGGATWGDGDFNGDFNVDDIDATLMAANWHVGVTQATVPEPALWILLAGGLLSLGIFRKGRLD